MAQVVQIYKKKTVRGDMPLKTVFAEEKTQVDL